MKVLIIITRDNNELDNFWGYEQSADLILKNIVCENQNIFLIKPNTGFDISLNYDSTSRYLYNELRDIQLPFELGVIFHKLNGDADANKFRENLKTAFNDKLAFCEWYSSVKTNFWDENNVNANLPYNNLKKAWKDNTGDKAKTFELVWDYFLGDNQLENYLKELQLTNLCEDNPEITKKVDKLNQCIEIKP